MNQINQEGVRFAHRTDLCFAICRFSRAVFIPQAQPHAQSLFLFPIVIGINPFHCHGTYIYVAKTTIPVAKDVYIRPTSISFLRICQSPATGVGCCCMSPRCLLRQFVDRCLLFWAFFIEKTVLLCFARFLSKWRETALWLFPDATS